MVTWDDLRELVVENCTEEFKEVAITQETCLIEDLKFDSVAIMQLLSDVEDKFGVDFTDLEDFGTRFNKCQSLLEGIQELQSRK